MPAQIGQGAQALCILIACGASLLALALIAARDIAEVSKWLLRK